MDRIKLLETDIFSLEKRIFPKKICGVYMLFLSGEIMYVGRSTDIISRINTHSNDKSKEFDCYSYIQCDPEDLDMFERSLIEKYLPKLNTDTRTMKLKKKYGVI